MFRIHFGSKAKKSHYEKALLQMAVTPAALNISMLSDEARGILEQYLQALYTCRVDSLPVEGMGEDCYREAVQSIQKQKAPSVVPLIQSFTMEDYDRRIMYKIRSITYRVVCIMQQADFHSQHGSWELRAVYDYDERMGWLLGSVRRQ